MNQQEPRSNSPDSTASPRISVFVPSHNHASFVGFTVRSIMRQTMKPSELLVIDDSDDDSARVIEKVLQECTFPCELIVGPKKSLCAALNEGLARTSGEYFAYLGSDDLWLQDFIEARINLLESHPRAVLAYGHAYLIDTENRIVDCTKDWADYADGDVRSMLLQTIAPISPTVLYRRDPLAKYGWNEQTRLEDYDLYLRLSSGGDFACDAQPRAAWREHTYNTSRDQKMMLDEVLKAQRQLLTKHFGMSADEIERLQTVIRFSRAEEFLRVGDKSGALRLMAGNLSGISSPRNVTKMLMRLIIPYDLMQWRRRRLQRKAYERYGVVEV